MTVVSSLTTVLKSLTTVVTIIVEMRPLDPIVTVSQSQKDMSINSTSLATIVLTANDSTTALASLTTVLSSRTTVLTSYDGLRQSYDCFKES